MRHALTFLPRRSTFFRGVVLALLVVLVPSFALQAYTVYRNWRANQGEVHGSVRLLADGGARVSEEVFRRAELLLTLLVQRPEARSMAPESCAELFAGLDAVSPVFVNLVLSDVRGNRICSLQVAPGSNAPRVEDSDWFDDAARASGFLLSRPRKGKTSKRLVAMLSHPVRGASSTKVGVLSVSIDLLRFSEMLEPHTRAQGLVLALVYGDGTIGARYPDGDTYIGRRVSALAHSVRARGDESVMAYPGVDGVTRIVASRNLDKYGLRVSAGVPQAVAYAEAEETALASGVMGLVMLLGALLMATILARRFARPAVVLMNETRAVLAGQRTRVPQELPGEFGGIALEFNRLLEAKQAAVEQQAIAAENARLLGNAYQALSATNRVITRVTAETVLFDELCGICVNFSHAALAAIVLHRGDHAEVVSASGQSIDDLPMRRLSLEVMSPDAATPAAIALREATPVVVSDFQADPRTARWRNHPTFADVKSSLAVPFRKSGRVYGALLLYATERDYFQVGPLALLMEVASDVGFALDNFDREYDRQAAEARSRRHEEQLAGIIKTAMDAIITVDSSFRIVVFNEAAASIFGVTASQALGLHLNHFIPERYHAAHGAHVNTFSRTGSTARAMGLGLELVGRRHNGTEFPVEASISKLGAGDELLMTVVLRDVTKLREAEALREVRIADEAANRARSDFLSRVSHELRTPLNAILGFTRLVHASAKPRLTADEEVQMKHALDAGVHLRELIDDVLDITRLDAGTLTVELQQVALQQLVDEVTAMARLAATEAGITVEVRHSEQASLLVRTDPIRLKQVFINLLSNAVKYNRPHGSVSVETKHLDGAAVVVVHDTGIGMTERQLDQLFQPFNRLGREKSAVSGTGIGLTLSRDLVELVGGKLEVSSIVDEGTTFTVTLPLSGLGSAHQPALNTPETSESTESPVALAGTVVYVEDTPVNIDIVRRLLSRWPQVVVHDAVDGAQGLQAVRTLRPDLVLLDMQLPDMTGLELLVQLRADQSLQDIPVVALSASVASDAVAPTLAAGAAEYWSKPIDFTAFLRDIRKYLRPATTLS